MNHILLEIYYIIISYNSIFFNKKQKNFLSDTDAAMAKVESSGYIPNAIMGGVGMRSELRRI